MTEDHRNGQVSPSSDGTEQQMRALLERAFDGFVELDAEARITDWNWRSEQTYGWSRAEVLGKSALMTAPERHHELVRDMVRRFFSDAVAADPIPGRALRRDGTEFPIEMSGVRLRRDGNERLAMFVRDMTERRQLEEVLREAQERSRHILDYIEDGYCEVDLRGNFICVNEAYARMFNRQKSDYEGANYRKFGEDKLNDQLRAVFSRVYQTGEPMKSFEFESLPGLFIEQSVSLKRDSKGNPTGFVSILRDCSARKRYERELGRAKEAAEEANRSKSQFLANMSHEVRTPMNGILGMTELALTTDLTDEQREFLSIVKSSGEALLVVLNDILDYSKMEAGKVALDPVRFSLSELAGDVLKTMSIAAHKKGLELLFHVPPDLPPWMIGDALRLRQVLLNLIGNAIKFTEQGEVEVKISVLERSASDATMQLEVRDTGIGIPQEALARLFQPFEQADQSTTRQYGGTGLGLAISRRIVELMGGRIEVASVPNQGTTFRFSMRLTIAQAIPETGLASLTDLEGTRVLIVDDNATNRLILGEMIRHWRMLAEPAESGEEGLSKLASAYEIGLPFRLILLDERMPGMDGFEVLERIRANPKLRGATIMMLTSEDQSTSAARCKTLGVEAYLIKPIKPSELLNTIRKALGQVEVKRPAERKPAVQPKSSGMCVLVAEDNLVNQKLAIVLLEKMGHEVTLAANGAEAVQKFEHRDFDLILMDVQMPEMDGFEATKCIRAREQSSGKHVPIIAMTAHAMAGDRERCLDAGMDEYISKPVRREILEKSIARLTAPAASAAK